MESCREFLPPCLETPRRLGINWQEMTGMTRPRELFKIFDLDPWPPNVTLPETNSKSPENGWLESYILFFWGPAYFQELLLLVSGVNMEIRSLLKT